MLTVISGPMFAGKTSALISICMSHVVAGDSVLAFKPAIDNRYDDKFIVSHNLDKYSCSVVDKPVEIWHQLVKSNGHFNVVAIDECQFFDPNTFISLVVDILEKKSILKRVICAGLSQDCKGYPFGAMPELLSMADEIISLKAVCSKCKGIGLASRTYRKPSQETGQILVGGADKYEARCFKCWIG